MTRWRTCNNRRRMVRRRAPKWYVAHARRWDQAFDRLTSRAGIKEAINELTVDLRDYSVAITKDGVRVDPNDFYAAPPCDSRDSRA